MAHCQADASDSLERKRVEISLSQQTETSLCRHGRRRFRDMQAASAAKLRLDRSRNMLKVYGTDSEVESIRRQLECLGGVRKVIPVAVWCELMRTRLEEDPERSTLQKMQAKCGCRIHIERSEQEVRIFGSHDSTMLAIHLIEDFARRCREVVIPITCCTIPVDMIEEIVETCHVSLNLEDDKVVVYGLQEATAVAAKRIREYMQEAESLCASADTSDNDSATGASSSLGSWYDGETRVGEGDCTPMQSEAGEAQLDLSCMPSPDSEEVASAKLQQALQAPGCPAEVPAPPAHAPQVPMLLPSSGQGPMIMLQQPCSSQVGCQWMVVGVVPQAAYVPSSQGVPLPSQMPVPMALPGSTSEAAGRRMPVPSR